MKKQSVGMLGLGIMGSAMAANLLRAGFTVIGYDPVAACRARHRKAGGIVAASALDVARQARILISSLPSADALVSVAKEISLATDTRASAEGRDVTRMRACRATSRALAATMPPALRWRARQAATGS